MRISYYFPPSPRLASYRYRIAIPGLELQKRGHSCEHSANGQVVVFSKHFSSEDCNTINNMKVPTVFDWCDDHTKTKWAQHYRLMASAATVVTCPTEEMKRIIWEDTHREAKVISDPYEYPESEPRHPGKRLFWFGHQSNLHTLKDFDIEGYELSILTGDDWSHKNMLKGFSETDMTIIPTNPEKQYKSPNRMVEAIRQGHYVIAGHMPAYEGYWQWIGDLKEGCDWANNDPDTAMQYIREGQKVVREHHSPQVIGDKWETLLKSLI